MLSMPFTTKHLNQNLEISPSNGQEIRAEEDKRWRAWNRKKGLALGYELHHKGKTKRGVIGYLGDISLTQYKARIKELIAQVQLYGFEKYSPTLDEYFEKTFLTYSKRHHKDQKSVYCSWNRLSKRFKQFNISEITRAHIEAEILALTDRGLSNASCNRTLSLIKKMLNLATADDVIDKSPAEYVKKMKEHSEKSVSLSDEVYRAYIKQTYLVPNQQHGYLLRLAGTSGCRIGELMALKMCDIADNNKSFVVRDTKNSTDREVFVGVVGKNAIANAKQFSTNVYLFSSDRSVQGHVKCVRHSHDWILKRLTEEFGMSIKFKVKDLRSTVGTKLYERTGDLKAVQTVLGHKTIGVTSDIYLHPSQQHQMQTVATIDELCE
jgi:site-specific recombinase XerD